MQANEALAVFNSRIVNNQVNCESLVCIEEVEREIRCLSRSDKGMEDTVFELGCSVLAKAYMDKQKERSV